MIPARGHKALRRGRISHPERVYHITFATRNRTPIFHDHVLAIAACRTFARTASSADAELLCWVLMPDHFHGLLQPPWRAGPVPLRATTEGARPPLAEKLVKATARSGPEDS